MAERDAGRADGGPGPQPQRQIEHGGGQPRPDRQTHLRLSRSTAERAHAVIAPATGIVSEVNEAAKAEPDMVSEDPLEEGWLIKLEIEDTSDLSEFRVEDEDDE